MRNTSFYSSFSRFFFILVFSYNHAIAQGIFHRDNPTLVSAKSILHNNYNNINLGATRVSLVIYEHSQRARISRIFL